MTAATAPVPTRLDEDLLAGWPLPRTAEGDKFEHGTVMVVGGATETPGAVILAGTAALRMGAGRLQIATAPTVSTAVAIAVPEALVLGLHAADDVALRERLARADAVLVGPGLVADRPWPDVLHAALAHARDDATVVVDAALLDLVAELDPSVVERWRGRLVLTPNRGEAASLLERSGGSAGDLDHDDVLTELATRTGAVITSFGTVCAPDGRRWRATSGHPSLGTSGSGDVLAGLVAGAAARAGDAAQAACWATWAHAAAGAVLGRRFGTGGFLARELLDVVGAVLPSTTTADHPDEPRDRRRGGR